MEVCQDINGNSSAPEGGFAGRAQAAFACIESQKSTGSLHAHIQVFLECLHQHTPLNEVLELLRRDSEGLIQKYLRFKRHVCRQVYADADLAQKRLPEREAEWPEYPNSRLLVSRPAYLSETDNALSLKDRIIAGKKWLRKYLWDHTQEVQ